MNFPNKHGITLVFLSAAFALAGCTPAASGPDSVPEEPTSVVWASMESVPDGWLGIADHGDATEDLQKPKLTTNLNGTCSYVISHNKSDTTPDKFITEKAGKDVQTKEHSVKTSEGNIKMLSANYVEANGKMSTAYHVFEGSDAIILTYSCQAESDWSEKEFLDLLKGTVIHIDEEANT